MTASRDIATDDSAEMYRVLFETMHAGVVHLDADGRLISANPAAERILGLSSDELRAKTPSDANWRAIDAEGAPFPGEQHPVSQALRSGAPVRGVKMGVFNPRRQEHVWIVVDAIPLYRPGEKTPYQVYAMFTDITEQHRAERELDQSEQRYRALFDRAPVGVFQTTSRGEPLRVNPALASMLHAPSPEATIAHYGDLKHDLYANPARRDEFIAELQREGAVTDFEYEAIAVDGARVWLTMNARIANRKPDGTFTIDGFVIDVTDRKRAADGLADTATRLNEAQRVGRIGDWSYHVATQEMTWSETMYELFERDPQLGPAGLEETVPFFEPEDGERFESSVAGALENGAPVDDEYRVRLPQGRVKYLRCSLRTERDPSGAVERLFGVAQDITAQKGVETALRESEQRFRTFVENASDIIYALSPDGIFTYISPNWQTFMGEPAERAIGGSFEPYVHPDDRQLCHDFLQTVLTTGRRQSSVEYRARRADGTEAWHTSTGAPLWSEQGELIGYIGIARDVTERKHAQEALGRSEQLFRQLFENMTSGVAIYDAVDDGADFVFKDINAAGERISDVKRADVIGRRVTDVFPGVEPSGILGGLREVWRTGEPKFIPLVEYDDERVRLWVENRIFKHPAGNVIAVYDDCTEQHRLEEQLLQSQKMEAVGRLAGGVAHDFNNVLTAIMGNLELAQYTLEDSSSSSPPDAFREELRQIGLAAQRAAKLTKQLLTFSRKEVTQRETLEVNTVLQSLKDMLERILADDIVFTFQPSSESLAVHMDRGHLEQVVLNLVINAGDAMPRGGNLTVTVEPVAQQPRPATAVTARHAFVLITVSDTGTGMDTDTQKLIWEPFFTTKSVGEGTGLGLATVYAIVKQSGGLVTVESEPEQGATFRVYLPAADTPVTPATPEPAAIVKDWRGTETILVCEDEPAVRRLVTEQLMAAGYTVLSATNGATALKLAKANADRLALLITDVVMPEMNGRDLVDRLHKMMDPPPTLFISGYSSNIISDHGVLDEGIAFLEKPFTRDRLLQRVRDLIDGSS